MSSQTKNNLLEIASVHCQVRKRMDSKSTSFHTKPCVKVKSLTVSPGNLSYMLGEVARSGCMSTMWPEILANYHSQVPYAQRFSFKQVGSWRNGLFLSLRVLVMG